MKRLHFPVIDSTNEAAKRLLLAGEVPESCCITADEQTAGKGTQGRVWISPPGAGLYMTVVHPAVERVLPVTTLYTLAAGIACVEAIEHVTGLSVRLKPVNDLYLDGCKLGGILTESLCTGGALSALITGIGINLRQAERKVAPDPARPVAMPTSLEAHLPPHVMERFQSEELTEAILAKLHFWYSLVWQGRDGQVQRAWERFQIMPSPCQGADSAARR
jgi:biotin-[acetyl-CoA-carboxylase] ligase BirA-like protein